MNICLQCNYEWLNRIDKPRCCPRCRSHNWDFEIPNKCKICKRTFQNLNIHHINGNHDDNRDSNKIRICNDCHSVIHNGLRDFDRISNNKETTKSRTRKYKDEEDIRFILTEYRNIWLKREKQNDTTK